MTGTDAGALTFYKIYQLSADYQITPKLRIGGLLEQIQAESATTRTPTAGASPATTTSGATPSST